MEGAHEVRHPLIIEYNENRSRMPGHIAEAIEGYLALPDDPSRITYDSPGGLFRLNYYTTGGNAVPSADTNSNGVPDFVERIAEYLDYSYDYECDTARLRAPPFEAPPAVP